MKIVIPGDPEHQPRLRHFLRGGRVIGFDPAKEEKSYIKSLLQDFLDKEYPNYQFPRNPKISMYFYCAIPSGMSKRQRWFAERGLLRKRTRPDSDNYVKLYFDCMNEILLEDDAHASIGDADKFFHKEPKTIIYLDEADEVLNMPFDEIEHFSESCEWIRAKTACHRDLISRPYEGVLQLREDPDRIEAKIPSASKRSAQNRSQ